MCSGAHVNASLNEIKGNKYAAKAGYEVKTNGTGERFGPDEHASYPMARDCPTIVMPIPFSKPKEIAMESIISNLLSRFEKGSLSRRELVQDLAMLAASGTAASAQEDINFKTANIDHVSVQVGNLQQSIDFYQKMFGFAVVSQAEEGGVKIVRLGNTKTLVSLNVGGPPGRVDHFAVGIPRFTRESITNYLVQRGATPLQGNLAGLHIKDPDGVNVQISSQT